MARGSLEPVIEFVSKCSASTFGVCCCGTGDPWVAFVSVLVVAVVVVVADIKTVFGAVELDLVPLAALGVLHYAL